MKQSDAVRAVTMKIKRAFFLEIDERVYRSVTASSSESLL